MLIFHRKQHGFPGHEDAPTESYFPLASTLVLMSPDNPNLKFHENVVIDLKGTDSLYTALEFVYLLHFHLGVNSSLCLLPHMSRSINRLKWQRVAGWEDDEL